MNKLTSFGTMSLACAAVSALLAGICSPALADSALDHARTGKKLVVGIQHVSPEYKAGMKFRSAESIDEALVKDLAERLHLPYAAVPIVALHRAGPGASASPDAHPPIVLTASAPDKGSLPDSVAIVPAGYYASPMAIMRSDTDIKSWGQLKGRKVCVSEDGLYVGTLAEKYGAIETVRKAPADSLLALRTGECDAAVHDSALLEELIKLPEWKKFSARLPAGPGRPLAFVVPSKDKETVRFLQKVTSEWSAAGFQKNLIRKNVHHVAFEVYLDQNAPDCH